VHKKYEDEDRLLQEIDRKNKEIHDLSNNTTKDIDGHGRRRMTV
jgi:hypothetical protein